MRPTHTRCACDAVGSQLLVEVDGEERGTRVEDTGQRAHERREQPRHDQAAQPGGHHVLHHQREGRLRRFGQGLPVRIRSITPIPGARPLRASARAIMPGTMKMNTGSSLRKAAKIVPRRASVTFGAPASADDVLVGAPVPEPDDRGTQQHARPRVVLVEVPRHAAGLLHRRPGRLRRPRASAASTC